MFNQLDLTIKSLADERNKSKPIVYALILKIYRKVRRVRIAEQWDNRKYLTPNSVSIHNHYNNLHHNY